MENSYYRKLLNDLAEKRAALDNERSALETAMAILMPFVPDFQPDSPAQSSDETATNGTAGKPATRTFSIDNIPHDAFLQMKMPEAIKALLGSVRKDLLATDIRDGLKAGGFKSTSNNIYPLIQTTLKRMIAKDEIWRHADKYGLADWYPNRKRPSSIDKAIATLVVDKDLPDQDER